MDQHAIVNIVANLMIEWEQTHPTLVRVPTPAQRERWLPMENSLIKANEDGALSSFRKKGELCGAERQSWSV